MKKLALICAVALAMASCSSLKIVDSNAAANAGAAALQALTISDAQVAQLCSQYMVESDGKNTILPADNSYTQRLNRIMARFHNISNLNLNYKVYQSNEVNAFASGDGSVRVYTGLMDAMNDDEVFAVIGHELGHLINKDVRDAYRAAYLTVAARYGIAAVNTTAGALSTGFLGDLAQELASNAYSRRQETQADETAVQFCVQNGVDPYAMYHALNVLIQLSGQTAQQGKLQELLSTHPDTYKRAAHVKQMCEAAGYSMTTSTPKTQNTSTGSGTTNTSGGGGKLKAGKKK
ncbi:MAG: M48 family metalloprotease [Bacteroidales bacterium]|jgi:putative metalloprotease|nr:M48 family metalloprotease [Bacteroidales bacterium]